jgi:arylsulfatase A-like enzyme
MQGKFDDYNIILVNLDGLRQDRLDICKNFKEICKNSLYFPNMISVAPYTLAAHHSIITGLYPSEHGVDAYHNMFKFKNKVTTISEVLKKEGFFTACNISSKSLMTEKGFEKFQIFDEYKINYKSEHKKLLSELSNKKKFFLFLHYDKLHTHLVKDVLKKYNETNEDEYYNNINKNKEKYDSHLEECDLVVKELLDSLKELKLDKKTILIFTSDHGTSCGEKIGEKSYGTFLYDYTLKVFCIIHIPNENGKIIKNLCSSLDLFPTIAELANVPIQNESIRIQGKNLLSFVNDTDNNDRVVFSETGGLKGPWPSPEKHNVFCIRNKEKKLIYNDTPQTWEFYDLKNDPNELNNIYDENLEEIIILKNQLLDHIKILNKDTKLT